MTNTYLLSALASGMALLLWPVQAMRNTPEKQAVLSVQQERPSAHVDVDEEEREMDMDVDMEMDVEEPQMDIEMDVEEPQVDVDIDRDEPEMDADHDQDDIDRDDVDVDVDHEDASFTEHEQEKIEKSFAMPAGAGRRTLEIDNVWGSIEVVGAASDQAQLTVNKSIRAESKGKIEQAKKEVTLDVTQQADALKLYVNGPFRCNCHDCGRSRDDDGYVVKMDFQVQVPRDVDIKIKTVNEGRVSVRDINGSFLVRNVNGDIQIRNIAGSGTARTVNGPVKVSFRQNPREESDFETVNGAIELQFARDLSADFRFKTFNGGIYSDFPVTALPLQGMQEERHGAKVVFRADRYTGARINAGGPQIKVENLNGDIRILENHE
ncbi:MAG: hypothetical protein JWO71_1776 [Candidatus Acidoferrum typicum]|nr:hypothetical protein [Candidatus Acidoferrum typicum]